MGIEKSPSEDFEQKVRAYRRSSGQFVVLRV